MLYYAPFPAVGDSDKDNKDKERKKKMIAMTSKKGASVRLDADFHLDTEKVYYVVSCNGCTIESEDFKPAARIYKTLSDRIEAEMTISDCLRNLVKAARALGYSVKEVA